MVTKPIPRDQQECPECGGRVRENQSDGTLTCESCNWKDNPLDNEETEEEIFMNALMREGVTRDRWKNLGASSPEGIRKGGALYVKRSTTGSIEVITNTDLEMAVGGKEAENMAEREGGRYRVNKQTLDIELILENSDVAYGTKEELREMLKEDGYPQPSDMIVDVARRYENSLNMTNTSNFWDHMERKHGITPPDNS